MKYLKKTLHLCLEWVVLFCLLWIMIIITDAILDVNIILTDIFKLSIITYSTLKICIKSINKFFKFLNFELTKDIQKIIKKD